MNVLLQGISAWKQWFINYNNVLMNEADRLTSWIPYNAVYTLTFHNSDYHGKTITYSIIKHTQMLFLNLKWILTEKSPLQLNDHVYSL